MSRKDWEREWDVGQGVTVLVPLKWSVLTLPSSPSKAPGSPSWAWTEPFRSSALWGERSQGTRGAPGMLSKLCPLRVEQGELDGSWGAEPLRGASLPSLPPLPVLTEGFYDLI